MERREANEQIDRVAGSLGGPAGYHCECIDAACDRTLVLPRDVYLAVRADRGQFVVAQGHERAEVDDVIARRGSYVVVRRPVGADRHGAADARD